MSRAFPKVHCPMDIKADIKPLPFRPGGPIPLPNVHPCFTEASIAMAATHLPKALPERVLRGHRMPELAG